MIREVQLGEFLPDLPDYKNPGLVVADNAYVSAGAYRPINSLTDSGITYTGDLRGVRKFDLPERDPIVVFGTNSDLFVLVGTTVTASGLSLSVSSGRNWSFEQFGLSIYATCKGVGTYRLTDALTDTTFSASAGSPPSAKYAAAFDDFLFLANIDDIDSSDRPYRLRWSGFNNPTASWVTDIGRQSGYVDMNARYGEITGLSGGVSNLVFQRSAISRVTYTGGASVFSKREVDIARGCIAPQSIVRVGGNHYFLAEDGFCRTNGGPSDVISNAKVFDWFTANSEFGREREVIGAVDWARKTIIWAFKGVGFASFNRALLYNWALDRWTTASFDSDWILSISEPGISIDATDASIPSDDDLDIDAVPFDDPKYRRGQRSVIAFHDGKVKYFSGPSLPATFEVGDFQIEPQVRSFVRSVRLIATSEGGARYQVGGRGMGEAEKIYSAAQTDGPLGFAAVASDALFHSVKVEIPAGVSWDKASAIQVDSVPSGVA